MESPTVIRVWSRQATVHIQLAPDYYEWREFAIVWRRNTTYLQHFLMFLASYSHGSWQLLPITIICITRCWAVMNV